MAALRRLLAPAALLAAACGASAAAHASELLDQQAAELLGVQWRHSATNSHDLLPDDDMPTAFDWCDNNGINACTIPRKQNAPQYCGSSWAFATVSALADRVKIARQSAHNDIVLSVQHLLNCGGVGTCYGGTIDGPYQWLHGISRQGEGISYETAQPYLACSQDSKEGFCQHVDTACKPINVARTCGSFSEEAGPCSAIAPYPNVSISDYGSISGSQHMRREIKHRGPIACGIDPSSLLSYTSGILTGVGNSIGHAVAVTGWGWDENAGSYWIVRNSWGVFWGEKGYARVAEGSLLLEEQCSWAVVKDITAPEYHNQVSCWEGGENCQPSAVVV